MTTNTQEIKRYHFVYRITNIKDKMYYYGTHTTSKSKETLPDHELGITYYSSKADKSFQKDQKENPHNYKYKILKVFSTREEALEMEIMLHNKFDVKLHKQFYNESNQTSIGFDTTGKVGPNKNKKMSDKTKETLRQANLGKTHTQETKDKMSRTRKGHSTSDETKRKIGYTNSLKTRTEAEKEHLRQLNLGKTSSKETKQKISKSLMGIHKGKKFIKVCCLACKKEIAFNRINVHIKTFH